MSHYPMRSLNLRAWQDNPERDEVPDNDLVDDEETEAAYWQAVDEATEMVKDGVWH